MVFYNIPIGMYWAIVTLTTVGFGDITPATPLGQFFSSIIMLLGYAIIAVPTGIVSSEMAAQRTREQLAKGIKCNTCGKAGLDPTDAYCKACGEQLP